MYFYCVCGRNWAKGLPTLPFWYPISGFVNFLLFFVIIVTCGILLFSFENLSCFNIWCGCFPSSLLYFLIYWLKFYFLIFLSEVWNKIPFLYNNKDILVYLFVLSFINDLGKNDVVLASCLRQLYGFHLFKWFFEFLVVFKKFPHVWFTYFLLSLFLYILYFWLLL